MERLKRWFSYSKTILAARGVQAAGAILAFHDFALPVLVGVDVTPISSYFGPVVWALILIFMGLLFEYLRRITKRPLMDKRKDAGDDRGHPERL